MQPPVSAWANGLSSYFSYLSTPKGRACFAMQTQVTLPVSACYWGDTPVNRHRSADRGLPGVPVAADARRMGSAEEVEDPGPRQGIMSRLAFHHLPVVRPRDPLSAVPQVRQVDGGELGRRKPKRTLLSSAIGALSTTTVESSEARDRGHELATSLGGSAHET